MNKKGAFIHWIVFGVVAAIGLYFAMTINLDVVEQNTKGVWQLSFVRAVQDAEKDMLDIDQAAKNAIALAIGELAKDELSEDLGCGKVKGYPLWNNPSGFFELKVSDKVKEKINKLITNKTGIVYDEIIYSDGSIVGKSLKNKVIGHSLDAIPKEKVHPSLFSSYEAYLIKPFDLRYEYNPGFRVKVSSSFGAGYEIVKKQAKEMLIKCENSSELKNCLDQNKEESWHYTYCETDTYQQEGRVVPFCIITEQGVEYKLALDFISSQLLGPENLQISLDKDQNTTTARFKLYPGVSTYKIYYTNWLLANSQIPPAKTAIEIFANVPKSVEFGFFNNYTSFNLNPEEENCPFNKEKNQPYLCSDQVIYSFEEKLLLNPGHYLFAVSMVHDEQESIISHFVSLEVN